MSYRPRTLGSRSIEMAIEEDLRAQLSLPFPDEKTIDIERCCRILHVGRPAVRSLMATPIDPSSDIMCLAGYQTTRNAPWRIDYRSLVVFLDRLRERHGIPDRRPAPIFGRYRDEDLLPFHWADTMTVEEAADILSIHRSKVLLRIEAGQFEAYQIASRSDWRISRSSLAARIASFRTIPSDARPYGGTRTLPGSSAASASPSVLATKSSWPGASE